MVLNARRKHSLQSIAAPLCAVRYCVNYNVSSPYNIIVNVYGLTRTIICAKLCQQTMKDIGVIFDDNLLFDSHIAIATTVNKCQEILSIIKRSFLFIL